MFKLSYMSDFDDDNSWNSISSFLTKDSMNFLKVIIKMDLFNNEFIFNLKVFKSLRILITSL